MAKYSRFDYGHRVGAKQAKEMGMDVGVEGKARGGRVGMPRINQRAGIKAPPKVAKIKSATPKPVAPTGIGVVQAQGFAKGGAVKSDMAQDKKTAAEAVHKHEKHLHKGQPETKLAKGGAVKKNFIKSAIKHPGALHKELGVPQGEKIPKKKIVAAAQKGGKLGQRARFAMTLSKMHKAKGGKVKGAY